MRSTCILVLALISSPLVGGQPGKDNEVKVPIRAKVVVVVAKMESTGGMFFGGKSVDSFKAILPGDTWLQAGVSIDAKQPDAKVRTAELNKLRKNIRVGGPLAVEGELYWDHELNLSLLRVWTDKRLGLADGMKGVDLLIAGATKIDDNNKAQFPAPGTFRVQGKAVCGKRDLKLVDEQVLAIENGKLPIVLDGDKGKVDARTKGIVEATGMLAVDQKGFLRLRADAVKDVKE